MALADDIASDMADFDALETVGLYTQRTNTTDSSVSALRRSLSHREVGADGPVGIEPRDTVWHLQGNTVTSEPKPGDKITTSGGTDYTVLSVTTDTLSTRYRCVCREQA